MVCTRHGSLKCLKCLHFNSDYKKEKNIKSRFMPFKKQVRQALSRLCWIWSPCKAYFQSLLSSLSIPEDTSTQVSKQGQENDPGHVRHVSILLFLHPPPPLSQTDMGRVPLSVNEDATVHWSAISWGSVEAVMWQKTGLLSPSLCHCSQGWEEGGGGGGGKGFTFFHQVHAKAADR